VSQGILVGLIGMTAAVVPMLPLGNGAFVDWLLGIPHLPVTFFCTVTLIMFLVRGAYGVFFASFYQQHVSPDKLGRFFAIMSLLFVAGKAVGVQLYGRLFDGSGLMVPILFLGAGMALKVAVHMPFMREERKRRQRGSE